MAHAQFDAEALYVSQSFETLYPDSNTFQFTQFNESKEKYRFYLVGEKHDHKGNREVELMMLKHLFKNNGVKYYLLENSYSGEYLLKKFLALPDTNLENNPYTTLLYRNKKKDFEEYYQPLHEFYNSLPEPEKLRINGIDLEMNLGQAFRTLHLILQQHHSTDSLMLDASDILEKGGKARGKRKLYKTIDIVDTLFRNNREIFKKTLKHDFKDFKQIIKGTRAGKAWLATLDSNNYQLASEIREIYMLENIMKIMTEHPKARFFGQFGFTHVVGKKQVWLGKVNNWKSLSWLLENQLGQSVCKTSIFYTKIYNKKIKYCAIQEEYEDLFSQYANEKLTLFNLNKPDSPFRKDEKPIKREYCKTYDGDGYPVNISLEFNYIIINNYFQL